MKTTEQQLAEFADWCEGQSYDRGINVFEAWQACQSLNDIALTEKNAEIARLREAFKEAISGLRKIEYASNDEKSKELATIFIANSIYALEQTL